MVHLLRPAHPSLYVTLLTLLASLRLAFASPVPHPSPHIPKLGEIVHYDPHHEASTGSKLPTLFKSHEATHITVGHEHGHALLAPVTLASQGHEHGQLRPHVSAHGMGALQGAVLLDHTTTAHPKAIHRASGKNRGHVVSAPQLETIQGARELVQAHLTAAAAHTKAHQAHRIAANAYSEAARTHDLAGHPAASSFEALAHAHADAARTPHRLSASHVKSAGMVRGPSPQELSHALRSARVAGDGEREAHAGAASARVAITKLGASPRV